MSSDCSLCAQIDGVVTGDLLHRLIGDSASYSRQVVDVDERLVLMPSVGALVEGHVLLCPREHLRSLAEVEDRSRLLQSVDHVRRELRNVADAPIQGFEHGNASSGEKVACTVEHAHLHMFPGRPDLWPLVRDVVEWIDMPDMAQIADFTHGREYVAYLSDAGQWRVTMGSEDRRLPSQWFRQVLATAIGHPGMWNWRENPNAQLTAASLRMARGVAERLSQTTAVSS